MARLDEVHAEKAAGRTITQVSGGDSASTESITMSVEQRESQIVRDLANLDSESLQTVPLTFAPAIRRTRPSYT